MRERARGVDIEGNLGYKLYAECTSRFSIWEMKMKLLVFVGICVYVVALSFFPMDTIRLWIDQLFQIFLIGWFPLVVIATIVLAITAVWESSRYLGSLERDE